MIDLLKVLNQLDVNQCDYSEWVQIGMALKEEGYEAHDWDTWSQGDERYKHGECEKVWNNNFNNNRSDAVSGGTIVHIARSKGVYVQSEHEDRELGFNETFNANEYVIVDKNWIQAEDIAEPDGATWDQVGEIIKFLELNFSKGDFVSIVNTAWQKENDGKFLPSKSKNDYVVRDVIADLKRRIETNTPQETINLTFGDVHQQAGAWIRINPMDGKGDKDLNIAQFKYSLIESDSIEIDKQLAIIKELELPVNTVVHSGGKSLHAWVKIDAQDIKQYKERVDFLFKICNKNGMNVDNSNRNPSRLSRLPGVWRGDKKQYIVATNLGKSNWEEWKNWVEELNDDLPDIETFENVKDDLPDLSPELIEDILRKGHKMIVTGPSKAGKSVALIELAISIAEGIKWMGKQCKQGRVLYLNLEIDKRSFWHRLSNQYKALGLSMLNTDKIDVWHLRGSSTPMDALAPKLIRRALTKDYTAIIIDPIYKVITGDENSAKEMAHFTNQFDKIAKQLDTSVIFCHHHSKGGQAGKNSMDRGAGSGVFSRDPDAILDIIELNVTEDMRNTIANKCRCEVRMKHLDKHAPQWREDMIEDDAFSNHQLSIHCDKLLSESQQIALRIELTKEEQRIESMGAFRIETTLREFAKAKPINIWFDYPIHKVDDGSLEDAQPAGEFMPQQRGKQGMPKAKASEPKINLKHNFEMCYENLSRTSENVTAKDISDFYGGSRSCSEKKILDSFKRNEDFSVFPNGIIKKKDFPF